jgi:hypothetical protein
VKRTLVFLLLGPILGVSGALLYGAAAGTRFGGGSPAFVFSLVVSTVTGLIDGILTYALPKAWRAALIAIVGATIAVGLIVTWAGIVGPLQLQELLRSPQSLLPFVIIGAFSMGACSLLSDNYRRSKA